MREITAQVSGKLNPIVCSVGGGGLLNGIIQAIDENNWSDEVEVLAKEMEGTDLLDQSLQAGRLITLPRITSQATSLVVAKASQKTGRLCQAPESYEHRSHRCGSRTTVCCRP